MTHNTDTTEAQIEKIVDKKVEQKLEEQLSQAQGSGFSRREILTGMSILGVGAAGATLGTYGAVGQTAEQNGSGSIGTEDRPLNAIYANSIGSSNTPVSSIHADTWSVNSLDAEQTSINDTSTDPSSNGEVRRNGSDVKVYSGGGLRNLSDIGSGSGYTDEEAQDAVGTILGTHFTYDDATPEITLDESEVDAESVDGYDVQKDGTDGTGIINLKTS